MSMTVVCVCVCVSCINKCMRFSPHSKAIELSIECWEYVRVCLCILFCVYVSNCVRRRLIQAHSTFFWECFFLSGNMISRAQTYCHAPVQMCCELQFMVDDNAMWRRNKQIYLHLFNGSIYKPHLVKLSSVCVFPVHYFLVGVIFQTYFCLFLSHLKGHFHMREREEVN